MIDILNKDTPVRAINVGAACFGKAIQDQGAEVRQVKWRPLVIRILDERTERILKILGLEDQDDV